MDLTAVVVGLAVTAKHRRAAQLHDQVAHDVDRIAADHPAAAALLARAVDPAPRDVVEALVRDIVRRIETRTG